MTRKQPDRRDHSQVPPRRRDVLWVETPAGGEKLRFLVYSPALWGCYTHYVGKNTRPCYEDTTLCEGGHSLLNRRWKAWLHCWSYNRNEPVFAQLTLEAANSLMEAIPQGMSLRGLSILLTRTEKKKGRQGCLVLDQYDVKPAHQMPQPLDPRRSIFNTWKCPLTDHPLSRHLNGDPPPLILPDPRPEVLKALNGCLKTSDRS